MITISRVPFAAALSAMSKLVEPRVTLPILSCVMLSPREATPAYPMRTLSLACTDLEVAAVLHLDASYDDVDPSMCVDVKLLMASIKAVPKSVDMITLDPIWEVIPMVEEKVDDVVVSTVPASRRLVALKVNGSVKVPAQAADDFPTIASPEFEFTEVKGLEAALEMAAPAMSSDDTRYSLNGVFLDVRAGHGNVVATDGHRMHVVNLPALEAITTAGEGDLILPKKAVTLLNSGFSKFATESIAVDDRTMFIKLKVGVMTCRRIEGTFPQYKEVIPKGDMERLDVRKTELVDALESALKLADKRTHAAILKMADGKVTITTRAEGTESEFVVTTGTYSRRCAVGLNARYLIDMLTVVDGPSARITFKDPGTVKQTIGDEEVQVPRIELIHPLVVRDGALTAIMMPMRMDSIGLEWADETIVTAEPDAPAASTAPIDPVRPPVAAVAAAAAVTIPAIRIVGRKEEAA